MDLNRKCNFVYNVSRGRMIDNTKKVLRCQEYDRAEHLLTIDFIKNNCVLKPIEGNEYYVIFLDFEEIWIAHCRCKSNYWSSFEFVEYQRRGSQEKTLCDIRGFVYTSLEDARTAKRIIKEDIDNLDIISFDE